MLKLPSSGELNRRITIRKWTDVPNVALDADQTVDAGIDRWAKVEPVGGVTYWGTKQTGENVTHRFWIRFGLNSEPEDFTGAHVIEWKGRRYRVHRATNVNDAQVYTMIEAGDLGSIA